MIAGCTVVKDEVDMIGAVVRHMLSQGADHVWVSDCQSTDGTREVLSEIDGVDVIDNEVPFYWAFQGEYIKRVADLAHEAGADWIVPFDADEYWTGTHGRTVAEALTQCGANRVHAEILQYADFDHRQIVPYPWTKVAFRWRPGLYLWAGNHGVNGVEGEPVGDTLVVHELKWRGYEHFVEKMHVKLRVAWAPGEPYQPGSLGAGLVVQGKGEVLVPTEQLLGDLAEHWRLINAPETVNEPIPSEFRPQEWQPHG